MKTNTIVSFIVATIVALLAVGLVSAGTLNVSTPEVTVNSEALVSGTNVLTVAPGETLPLVIRFTANEDLQDLKIRAWVDGYKSDVSASTSRFDVWAGSLYSKKLTLTLPSVEDMDSNPEALTLYVSIADRTDDSEVEYTIKLQRETYSLNVLSVEIPSKASAGEIIALDVVLKNLGARDAEDVFVTASIPELGVSKKAYFGDIYSDESDETDTDNEDARERRLYLVIPADIKSGDYTLEVKASDYDTTATAKKVISITGLDAATNSTATPVTTKDKIPTSVIILTVALVIIFVVLLIVLVVLLTKKPSEKVEDFGETNYY